MTAKCVMVLGTTSGAGKSWLTTALCRYYARQGLKVAPFKAQNMSNNARVVAPTLVAARTSRGLAGRGSPDASPLSPVQTGAGRFGAAGSSPGGANFPWGGPAENYVAVDAVGGFAAGPSQGEMRPPRGAGSHTQWATVGADERSEGPPRASSAPSGGSEDTPVPSVGAEIGSAQYFQALAARALPEVRMNPLLLKPEQDTHSQVILMGQVSAELSRMAWRGRSASVWPVIAQALDELIAENDVVVIEGAGSPAEINLKSSDIVNMRVAQHAQAACLLVTDIDRGGAFAHLYGTWMMLDESERRLIKGFVLNKFRGDASLLAPAPQMLQDLTGVPTVATLPMWWQHGLPEEDGMFDMAPTLGTGVSSLPPEGALAARGGSAPVAPVVNIAVIAYPRISNLDEFQPLKNVPGVHLKWVRHPAELAGLAVADWIILPGSKHTSSDLAWLRAQGLDQAIAAHAGRGGAVLGICGGLQMLGEALIDTHGIDGNGPGLGLLPLVTQFAADKTVRHREARFLSLTGPWSALSGVAVAGYEIHHGQTAPHSAMAAAGDIAHAVMPDALAWQNGRGNVLGIYLHGLFEDPAVLQALFGASVPTLETVFDGLADYISQHFEPGVLQSLID